MSDAELIKTLIETQRATTNTIHKMMDKWAMITLGVCITACVVIVAVSCMMSSVVKSYFYSDYLYPSIEQNVEQHQNVGGEY